MTTGAAERSTRRTLGGTASLVYQADWDKFTTWCSATDRQPLPATSDTVAMFLDEMPAAPATLRRRVTSINHVHRQHELSSPAARMSFGQ